MCYPCCCSEMNWWDRGNQESGPMSLSDITCMIRVHAPWPINWWVWALVGSHRADCFVINLPGNLLRFVISQLSLFWKLFGTVWSWHQGLDLSEPLWRLGWYVRQNISLVFVLPQLRNIWVAPPWGSYAPLDLVFCWCSRWVFLLALGLVPILRLQRSLLLLSKEWVSHLALERYSLIFWKACSHSVVHMNLFFFLSVSKNALHLSDDLAMNLP